MADYRRHFVCGGQYFFTVVLADRSSGLLTERIQLLRNALKEIKKQMPFGLDAIVILPDHLHCIWSLPPGDSDFSTRWKKIKALFSREISKSDGRSASLRAKGERGIWQRRFWEHSLRDEQDFERHFDYIHFNPVKHGYVERVADWPYSSFHRHVRLGGLPEDWAGGGVGECSDEEFGE
jgi:putative transposase